MADILVNGNFGGGFQQSTSFAMIPTIYDQLNQYGIQQSTPQSAILVTTPPTFAGITSNVAQNNGSLFASWGAASASTLPLFYDVYIQANTATGLFSPGNLYDTVHTLSTYIFTQGMGGPLLVKGVTYFVGVKVRDRLGNLSAGSVSLSAVSLGVNPNRVFTPDDVPLVWSAIRSLNQVAGSFGEALQGIITATRAGNLDNIGASRMSNLDGLTVTRANNLDNLDATVSSRATQASVDAIQNATTFVGVVPGVLVLPASGTKTYRFYASLYDDTGMPENPDGNMDITITDSAGAPIVSTTAMTNEAVGRWYFDYVVNSTDVEQSLRVIFDYVELSIPFRHYRVTEVQEFESKLDVLISRLTAPRAANLDNLDVAISSRQSTATALSQYNQLDSDVLSRQSTADALSQYNDLKSDISTKQEAADSITQTNDIRADIAQVETDADALSRYNDLKSDIAALDTQSGDISADLASIKADTQLIGAPLTTTVVSDIDRLYNRIGVPANVTIAADIAQIEAQTSLISNLGGAVEIEGVVEDSGDELY